MSVRGRRLLEGAGRTASQRLLMPRSRFVSFVTCIEPRLFSSVPSIGSQSRSFSSPPRPDPSKSRRRHRPYISWLDPKLPLERRVQKFVSVELGELWWQPATLDSVEVAVQCCRYKEYVGMNLAHQILDRCLAEYRYRREENNETSVVVPYKLFETLLYGWACLASKGQIARHRMRELMDMAIQLTLEQEKLVQTANNNMPLHNNHQGMPMQPTTYTYNIYLLGLKNSCSGEAAKTAKQVLDEMLFLHRKYGWHTKPNTKSYTHVVSAFANSGYKDSGQEAEKILRRVQRMHQQEKDRYFSQYGVHYNPRTANKRRIVTADATLYSHVIQAYARDPSERSAAKARDLLIEVMSTTDGTVQPDFALLGGTIAAYTHLAGNPRISKPQRLAAAQQAEELLEACLQDILTLETNHKTRDKEGIQLVAPYNAVMNAYAKCDAPDSALKAESMLQKLISDFTEGRSPIHPDTISFNTVLNAWARSVNNIPEAPQKAEELMKLQLQLVDLGSLPETCRPDATSFGIVMSAYARSNEPNRVQHTQRLLGELIHQATVENKVSFRSERDLLVCYTSVLEAAAHPQKNGKEKDTTTSEGTTPLTPFETEVAVDLGGSSDDYSIALQTYRELKDDVFGFGCQPDDYLFAKMLLVVGVHTGETSAERRQMAQLIFEDACQAGQVSRIVLKSLFKIIADKQLIASLLQNEEFAHRNVKSVDELPRLWTRNVPFEKRNLKRVGTRWNNYKRFNKVWVEPRSPS